MLISVFSAKIAWNLGTGLVRHKVSRLYDTLTPGYSNIHCRLLQTGSFELKRNDRVPNPVCRPSSLEISVTKIPADGEWGEDWFTTWKSRRDNPNNLVVFAQDEMRNQSEPKLSYVKKVKKAVAEKVSVEIGMLCTVRLRGGGRVSRVHPVFTISLWLSRW